MKQSKEKNFNLKKESRARKTTPKSLIKCYLVVFVLNIFSMGDLRGSFTIDEKKEFPSLLFLAGRVAFYINNNTISNLERTVNHVWECKCHRYSG